MDQVYSQMPRLTARWTILVGALSFGFCIILSLSSRDPLMLYPFRESQTAISADYLLREPEGGILAYQTPVLGVPWRLPFEFPLFQWLTACIARCGLNVAQAGRLVSLLSHLGCLLVADRLLRRSALPVEWRRCALGLFLASPVYALYATAHLIESLALLLALLFLLGAICFTRSRRSLWLVLVATAGSLCAMVKITTWFPAAIVAFLLAVGGHGRDNKVIGPCMSVWRRVPLTAVVSAGGVAGLLWSLWAAHVRSANPLAQGLGSHEWIFGSMSDRLSLVNWGLVIGKHLLFLFGPAGLLVPFLLIWGWYASRDVNAPVRAYIGIGVLGYLAHASVFFNLNLRHDYYVYAAGVFLLFAAVSALAAVTDTAAVWPRQAVVVIAVSMLVGSGIYGTIKRGYRDPVVERCIATLNEVKTPGALLMFGFDWSPRIPFAVGRKAVMLGTTSEATLNKVLEWNKKVQFAAVVAVGRHHESIARTTAQRFGFDIEHPVRFWPEGYVFVDPHVSAVLAKLPVTTSEEPVLEELRRLVPQGAQLNNGIVLLRFGFDCKDGEWFEMVVKRGTDAFVLRGSTLSLVRVRGFFGAK